MTAPVVRTLYRSFLRTCKEVDVLAAPLRIADVPRELPIGRGGFVAYSPTKVYSLVLPNTTRVPPTTTLRGSELAHLVRSSFRAVPLGDAQADAIQDAFDALRALRVQVARSAATQVVCSMGIDVEVAAYHLPRASEERGKYAFPYRIRFINHGTHTVRVAGRHWVFEDAEGGSQTVPHNSPGVVGEFPILKPGAAFEYMSLVELSTPHGWMRGSFQCVDLDTEEDVELAAPTTRLDSACALPQGYAG